MRILVIGGSSSGKSMLAQRICRCISQKTGTKLVYFATMCSSDAEDDNRIQKHKQERAGWGFHTIECGRTLSAQKVQIAGASVLLDSTTAALSNEMFLTGQFVPKAGECVYLDLQVLSDSADNMVVVGDNLFEGSLLFEQYTHAFISTLGKLHKQLAENFDMVIEVIAGEAVFHKGKELNGYVLEAL